ncbi:hypothetical protein C8R43DRAFT_78996 [Mycena crocata]|nr:hypothetical protein C8R43DRAFT_78996 [Mycena crocata]
MKAEAEFGKDASRFLPLPLVNHSMEWMAFQNEWSSRSRESRCGRCESESESPLSESRLLLVQEIARSWQDLRFKLRVRSPGEEETHTCKHLNLPIVSFATSAVTLTPIELPIAARLANLGCFLLRCGCVANIIIDTERTLSGMFGWSVVVYLAMMRGLRPTATALDSNLIFEFAMRCRLPSASNIRVKHLPVVIHRLYPVYTHRASKHIACCSRILPSNALAGARRKRL